MMRAINTMTLTEIEATLAALRARRKALKASRTVAQRKILTLARRRERLLAQVQALDAQIAHRRTASMAPAPLVAEAPCVRHRRPAGHSTVMEAIIACVQRHGRVQRATIVAECQLPPMKASVVLRRLCQAGTLVRHGKKRQTTYSLP